MTEYEWMACPDPKPMLEFLQGRISDRKLRLFACACCRRVWNRLEEPSLRRAVEVSERFAEGHATLEELAAASSAAAEACERIPKLDVMAPENDDLDQWAFILDEQRHFLAWLPGRATVFASCAPGTSTPAAAECGRGDYVFWVINQVVLNVARTAGYAITAAHYSARKVYDDPADELAAVEKGERQERSALSDLLRYMFGNPFQTEPDGVLS